MSLNNSLTSMYQSFELLCECVKVKTGFSSCTYIEKQTNDSILNCLPDIFCKQSRNKLVDKSPPLEQLHLIFNYIMCRLLIFNYVYHVQICVYHVKNTSLLLLVPLTFNRQGITHLWQFCVMREEEFYMVKD